MVLEFDSYARFLGKWIAHSDNMALKNEITFVNCLVSIVSKILIIGAKQKLYNYKAR